MNTPSRLSEPVALGTVDRWWRAANYLTVGQIYLMSNPLLRHPLTVDDIKPRLLGHWGTSPGLSFVYAHLNRIIIERGVPTVYICGPGHGGPAMVANTWLDGTYSQLFPHVATDIEGMGVLMRQFSFPGGIPSHAAPETPGSINEGGELGYSLMHAYGAAFDNPDLVVACVIGDGESETGSLAASWRAHAFLDPRTDGAVLPILHLNGYKIANPTLLARIPESQLVDFLHGNGYEPIIVEASAEDDPMVAHERMARALDECYDRIAAIQADARQPHPAPETRSVTNRASFSEEERFAPGRGDGRGGSELGSGGEIGLWPMIVLRTPKGWTGPKVVDGVQVEGTFHAHQVPLAEVRENPEHLSMLEEWMRSYGPEELFDLEGQPVDAITQLRPPPNLRMSASDHMNGGLTAPLRLTDPAPFAVDIDDTRTTTAKATTVFGRWLAEVMGANDRTFRLFGPDEVASNRLDAVFDVTNRVWAEEIRPHDEHLARHGRVIEALSENLMQGLLEGYLLTGRHGLFTSYEAFIHIVDSMFNQHAKWLESASRVPWRQPVASLNYLLSSHVWRQDHNGFSHQDPGFLNVVVTKQAEIVRIYLPPDANTLLVTMEHVFGTTNRVNVVVAGKQEHPAWLSLDEAREHVAAGLSVWHWAGSEAGAGEGETGDGGGRGGRQADARSTEPDVVLACAGDVPTMETVAAAQLLRERLPQLRIRLVNVVDLMRLESAEKHPHGLDDASFDAIFTTNRPVIFAFHGYPSLIHQLTYRRTGHDDIHVRGYVERGTTTTPFDMVHLNDLDRYRLALDVLNRVPGLADQHDVAEIADEWHAARENARAHAYRHGEDPDWITGWTFQTSR